MTVVGIVLGLGTDKALVSDRAFIDAVVRVGGTPFLIPATVEVDLAVQLSERVDALLLLSGGDIHPHRYGENVLATLAGVDEHRDHVELAVIAHSLHRKIRIFGVCRGAQILVVAHGGRLCQDVVTLGVGKHADDTIGGHFASVRHGLEIKESTLASELFPDLYEVNSQHHQAVIDTGVLTATAWSADGVIEAVEGPNCFGVQWHPELIIDEDPAHLKPFEWLVRNRKKNAC